MKDSWILIYNSWIWSEGNTPATASCNFAKCLKKPPKINFFQQNFSFLQKNGTYLEIFRKEELGTGGFAAQLATSLVTTLLTTKTTLAWSLLMWSLIFTSTSFKMLMLVLLLMELPFELIWFPNDSRSKILKIKTNKIKLFSQKNTYNFFLPPKQYLMYGKSQIISWRDRDVKTRLVVVMVFNPTVCKAPAPKISWQVLLL